MKRPVFIAGTSYFIATWLAFQAGEAYALRLSAAAFLTAALCFLLRDRRRYMYAASAVFLTAALAFAGFWMYTQRKVAPLLEIQGKSATVEGLITEVDTGPASTSYTLRASFTEYPDAPSDVTVIIRSSGELEHGQGDTIRCRASFAAAPDTMWYKSRGIALIGRNVRDIQDIPTGRHSLQRAMIRLRDRMARNLYARLDEQSAHIVAAMVLGMKNDVPPGIQASMSRSGTAHILSISGLHLSILSAFALALMDSLRCPKRLGAAIALVLAFLFAAMVGFAASVFRAFVMTAAALSGRIISRRGDSLSSLGLALLICGIFRPNWVLGWGLWLSACATLGIILFGSGISSALYEKLNRGSSAENRLVKAAANAGGVSVAAYAFTMPVLLLMCGWISLISPLANILVAPFVPVSVLGGVACAILPGAALPVRIVARLTDLAVSITVRISGILSELDFAIIAIDESWILIWLFAICVFAVVLFVNRAGKKLVNYALALLVLSFSVGNLSLLASNRSSIELVTLSQYDTAVLLRDGEAVILGAPDAYEISNLLRYLDFRGVRTVPAVIAADCGEQISSGILRLADAYNVDCVIGPDDAYIVSALKEAMPGSLVYPGGYAETSALGGAVISLDMNGDIKIDIGKNQIVKTHVNYDIIKTPNRSADGRVEIYNGGTMLIPKQIIPAFEPVGGALFGESRILLAV